MGAVAVLAEAWRWYPWGSLTADEAADAWNDIINEAYENSFTDTCPVVQKTPTPYWDTDDDVDDEFDPDLQPWYGYVEDLGNPTTTFVEDAAIWATTGLLAVSATPAAAILFHTIAPAFVVAVRRGEYAEIIRLYLDGEEAAEVDTSTVAEGELIRVTLAGDPEIETHALMLVNATT